MLSWAQFCVEITHRNFSIKKAMKESGCENQLLPGVCTMNIAYGLLIQAGYLSDIVVYMGTDKLRFLAPVYPGNSIRMETEIKSKKKTRKGRECEYDWNCYKILGTGADSISKKR